MLCTGRCCLWLTDEAPVSVLFSGLGSIFFSAASREAGEGAVCADDEAAVVVAGAESLDAVSCARAPAEDAVPAEVFFAEAGCVVEVRFAVVLQSSWWAIGSFEQPLAAPDVASSPALALVWIDVDPLCAPCVALSAAPVPFAYSRLVRTSFIDATVLFNCSYFFFRAMCFSQMLSVASISLA